jgi:hypothetical protein
MNGVPVPAVRYVVDYSEGSLEANPEHPDVSILG